MKKTAVNILCSTGITLIILAAVATMFGAHFLLINSVFQCFTANIIIYIGLKCMHRFESSYAAIEYALDIGYIIAVVLISGAAFDWYSSTPVFILIIMSVIIYLICILLSIFQMRQDIEEINELLKKRNNTSTSKEIQK